MSRIDRITKAQAARFPEWVSKYIEIGLSTAPADFDAATEAALRVYKLCNLNRPQIVLRMGSPYGATLGGILAWAMLRAIPEVRSQVGSQVESQVRSQVESQVWSQVGSQVGSQVRSQVGSAVLNYRGGAFWASWTAYVSFMRDVLGWDDPVLENFKIDEILATSCGWVWWHENVLAISDRPQEIHRDNQGRLHNHCGPSISYRDGWALHHWHGVLVPAHVIEAPQTIAPDEIDAADNAEVRRVMIERYGASRYLLDSGAKVIHHDAYGKLYRKELADDEPIVMVRVLNSTPEPDGTMTAEEARATFGSAAVDAVFGHMNAAGFALGAEPRFKEYMLRVPPTMRTAHEAVAWTFGKTPEEYRLQFQS